MYENFTSDSEISTLQAAMLPACRLLGSEKGEMAGRSSSRFRTGLDCHLL